MRREHVGPSRGSEEPVDATLDHRPLGPRRSRPGTTGGREPDADLTAAELRRLVECGPWAQVLVADHPNTSSEVLDALAHAREPIKVAVAGHPSTASATLAHLCAESDDRVRRLAARQPRCPDWVLQLMRRAGAATYLDHVGGNAHPDLTVDEIELLAGLGPWGRFLAGRQAGCPRDLLETVVCDPDWRVRSAVLDNRAASDDVLVRAAGLEYPDDADELRVLADAEAPPELLSELAVHPQAEVRLAVARHPAATVDAIGLLVVDRVADVRRIAAGHPQMDAEYLSLLVRAGSTPDLARRAAPDDSITAVDLSRLARGGSWARQLAVRHPDTAPDTLAHLLCDDDPKLREWAAAHPSTPPDITERLLRAGAAQDFQGVAEADPEMPHEELRALALLGPYAAWVVSWHPDPHRELRRPPQESHPRSN